MQSCLIQFHFFSFLIFSCLHQFPLLLNRPTLMYSYSLTPPPSCLDWSFPLPSVLVLASPQDFVRICRFTRRLFTKCFNLPISEIISPIIEYVWYVHIYHLSFIAHYVTLSCLLFTFLPSSTLTRISFDFPIFLHPQFFILFLPNWTVLHRRHCHCLCFLICFFPSFIVSFLHWLVYHIICTFLHFLSNCSVPTQFLQPSYPLILSRFTIFSSTNESHLPLNVFFVQKFHNDINLSTYSVLVWCHFSNVLCSSMSHHVI